MASFKQKKISKGQTLADKLNKARLSQDLEWEEIHKATNIQIKYLQALENGDYNELPGDIYAKAWIKVYGEFLGLPSKELLVDYKIEKALGDRISKIDNPQPINKPNSFHILKPKVIKASLISILIFIFLGYLGWEINNIIAPPEVDVWEPNNNFKTTDSSIMVRGRTKAEVQLTINNELVLLDKDGNFSQTVNLVSGLNNLQISAKKKHSQANNLELVILREVLQ